MQVMPSAVTSAAFAAPGSAAAPTAPASSFAKARLSSLQSHMKFPPK
jgi:hypothetical protein